LDYHHPFNRWLVIRILEFWGSGGQSYPRIAHRRRGAHRSETFAKDLEHVWDAASRKPTQSFIISQTIKKLTSCPTILKAT
jgi:hypothetical protein